MAEDPIPSELVYKANGTVTARSSRGLIKINPYFKITQKKDSSGSAIDGVDVQMTDQAMRESFANWADYGTQIQTSGYGTVKKDTLKKFKEAGDSYKEAAKIPPFYIEAEDAKITRNTPLKSTENASGAKMAGTTIKPSITIEFKHTVFRGDKESWADYVKRRSEFIIKYEDCICLVTSEMFKDAAYMQFTVIDADLSSGTESAVYTIQMIQLDEDSVLYKFDQDYATTVDKSIEDAQNSETEGSTEE